MTAQDHPRSAMNASALIDLYGVDTFADEAVTYIVGELGDLGIEQRALIKAGALKGVMLVAAMVHEFAERG